MPFFNLDSKQCQPCLRALNHSRLALIASLLHFRLAVNLVQVRRSSAGQNPHEEELNEEGIKEEELRPLVPLCP